MIVMIMIQHIQVHHNTTHVCCVFGSYYISECILRGTKKINGNISPYKMMNKEKNVVRV